MSSSAPQTAARFLARRLFLPTAILSLTSPRSDNGSCLSGQFSTSAQQRIRPSQPFLSILDRSAPSKSIQVTSPAQMEHSPSSYHHHPQSHHHQHHSSQSHPSQSHTRQQNLFPHNGQLPPPSSLNLPMPSLSRTNTLPPLAGLSHSQDARYPPHSYHPSLASPSHSHTLPSPSSSGHSASTSGPGPGTWSAHRTSSSRDESHPDMRRRDSKSSKASNDGTDGLREPTQSNNVGAGRAPPPSASDQKDGGDDGMSATSDFVKKLYK